MEQMNQTQTLNTQTGVLEDELAKMEYFDSDQGNWKIVFYPHLTNGSRAEAGGKNHRMKNNYQLIQENNSLKRNIKSPVKCSNLK